MTATATRRGSLCLFRLGPRRFALHLDTIGEVVESGDITPLPGAPDFLMGLANVRGEIIPVIDITPFVGGERLVPAFENPLLILRDEEGRVGVVVHRVIGVRDVDTEAWPSDEAHYVLCEGDDGDGGLAWIDIARILRDGRRELASL